MGPVPPPASDRPRSSSPRVYALCILLGYKLATWVGDVKARGAAGVGGLISDGSGRRKGLREGSTREGAIGRLRLFCVFAAAQFVSFFYNASNAILAPDISRDLSLSAGELGFTVSLFFAVFAAAQLPIGAALDRWGPRAVVPGLMMVGVVGSLIFASAHSFGTLALGRVLIGAGMAPILMGAFKAFSRWFSPGRFASVSGLLMGIGAFGTIGASSPLAWASQQLGWRPVFVWGSLLAGLSAASILLWARDAPTDPEGTPEVRGPGGFLEVFRYVQFWRIAPMGLLVPGALFALQALWAGPYLFDAVGLSKVAAGNVLLLMGLGVAFGFVTSGWLADLLGAGRTALVDGSVFLACELLLALSPSAELTPIVFFLMGLSGGGAAVVLLAQTRLSFPPEMIGRAVSATNSCAFAGAFLLQWLIGTVVDLFPTDAPGHYPPQAYTAAFLVTAAGTALALVWYGVTGPKAPHSSRYPPPERPAP